MGKSYNDGIRQVLLLGLIIVVGVTITWQLYAFIPGMLGAITFYILMRERYFKLTDNRGWKKWVAATVFILAAIIIFAMPIVLLVQMLVPKFNALINNTAQLEDGIKTVTQQLKDLNLPFTINSEQIIKIVENITSSVPQVLGATANMITNGVLAFFMLYFMLSEGHLMEKNIKAYTPLSENNVNSIWQATRTMVKANAIGIPVLAASQAIAAAIGYLIFGVESYILWGVITGIFSVVPILGCMIVWLPICVYLYATGEPGAALGLAIYSFVITGGVDNVLRFTILKKLGDIHPITTTLGIIVGVPLFGFMGFIFGPLLVSYLLLLIKVYRLEFVDNGEVAAE